MAVVKHKLYGKFDFLPLLKLGLAYEAMFSLLGSHLDLSEHIIMTLPCRLIDILEVATNKKTFSYAESLGSTCEMELFLK